MNEEAEDREFHDATHPLSPGQSCMCPCSACLKEPHTCACTECPLCPWQE